jgi:hypothetical protein
MKNVFYYLVLTLFSCKESTPEAVDLNEGTYTEVLRDTIIDDKNNYWDSTELKLPKGVVIDCTNCTSEVNQKISDNYVTIKKTNGVLTIIRDIDVDTYLNLKINDIIK